MAILPAVLLALCLWAPRWKITRATANKAGRNLVGEVQRGLSIDVFRYQKPWRVVLSTLCGNDERV
jgi:hypothetical protein